MSAREPESVWDYPRPPAVRAHDGLVEVHLGGGAIASTEAALEVLETSHPPTFYLPRSAFADGALVEVAGTTWCEFKGQAAYFDLVAGEVRAERAAWHYPDPVAGYEALRDHIAVMPASVEACYVDGERVQPQAGGFYGGWITSAVVGPFKGEPGTWGW